MKNFLNKKVENVTAPKEWQSSPDSPPTKLAYITQPEIDLLVKANIHGSMKGKPNKGPQGKDFGRELAVMMKKDNLIIKHSGNKLTTFENKHLLSIYKLNERIYK